MKMRTTNFPSAIHLPPTSSKDNDFRFFATSITTSSAQPITKLPPASVARRVWDAVS
ncbi:MAG: hypothetical protein Q9192_008768, partial [Flavoplaca navasiana]